MLEKRAAIILRRLCEILNPYQVYTTISHKLIQRYHKVDVNFICKVVQTLDYVLITEKVNATIYCMHY